MNRIVALALSVLLNIFLIINHYGQYQQPSIVKDKNVIYEKSYCIKFDQQHRLSSDDLSARLTTAKDTHDNTPAWDICKSKKASRHKNSSLLESLKYCAFQPTIEQSYQLQFFPEGDRFQWPRFSDCVILPPTNYQWPNKYVKYPVSTNESAVFWSNLGLKSYNDVRIFNQRYPKNVYHFNAPLYDLSQELDIQLAAKYIPFGEKIRIMLEIGAGGGSISIALSKRYDVIVLNTVRPEFPYCEYISERGALCMLLDSRRPMPFAKFTFDVIHHSWVYHGLSTSQWRTILLEQNRLLRPGGYLWMQDGSSRAVYVTIKFLFVEQLGYKILYAEDHPRISRTVSFYGSDPFEISWNIILRKPDRLDRDHVRCL